MRLMSAGTSRRMPTCQWDACSSSSTPRRLLVQASAKGKESSKSSEGGEGEDIYIGQGKWVKDDPKKYPSKSQWAGGWAGGEEGLQKWLEEQEKSQGDDSDVLETRPTGPSTKLLGGKDVLYTGKGNYVRDNAEKYPTKDGLVGGFAGGERGVDAYVSDGEVSFDENAPPQNSPLVQAFAMSATAILISSAWFILSGRNP